jgi:adenylate cyclase
LRLAFLYKLLIYAVLFLLIVFVTYPVAASLELDTSLTDPKVWAKYRDYFASITHLSTALQLALAVVLSLFYSEISDFIGQGVLLSFFTGKYHNPVEEERIFMFCDMKSSTTIAEKLGHQQYFSLLKAYYDTFTDAIVDHEGAIYQYVGDEIILSWKVKGSGQDHQCLNCFFAMRESLRQRAAWFDEQFGVAPTFKAGIHLGKVTTGEIGVIKKELLFSGDVLNATARIQGLCNTYGVDLIISSDLKAHLALEEGVRFLGEAELRGRAEAMGLYTVG